MNPRNTRITNWKINLLDQKQLVIPEQLVEGR